MHLKRKEPTESVTEDHPKTQVSAPNDHDSRRAYQKQVYDCVLDEPR
jgi:hypothetical protein